MELLFSDEVMIKQTERQKISLVTDSKGKKYLKRELVDDRREVYKLLQKTEHPNIPKIYDVSLSDNTVITEEYIEGLSLAQLMQQNYKFTKKEITSIAKQVLSALRCLHSENIIHRDVKPDNIMMNKSGHIWITDFDIARIYREEIRKDTEAMGTFGYAPIEQFGMMPTDRKTDIYAFGVTLKTLLDFSGIKGDLRKIAKKCTRLDPADRYESAEDVLRAIQLRNIKFPIIFVTLILTVAVIMLLSVSDKNTTAPLPQQEAVYELPDEDFESQNIQEETFSGFAVGKLEEEYSSKRFFSGVCIFNVDSPWEHLLFLEDMNKKGRIRIGENTTINADVTLNNGILSVNLNDGKGNSFTRDFYYDGRYEYDKSYTDNIRVNADIICFDLDYDGEDEFLIGVNESVTGAQNEQVYSFSNYSMAWCVEYDSSDGFTLCDGDMFSKGRPFDVNTALHKLNIAWEDIGDITGYRLEKNKIQPLY